MLKGCGLNDAPAIGKQDLSVYLSKPLDYSITLFLWLATIFTDTLTMRLVLANQD